MRLLSIIIICFYTFSQAQENIETVYKGDFTIRDITISGESIFFLEKWNVLFFDTKEMSAKKRFIGGYGLELYSEKKDELITVSNELVENVSSIRFFHGPQPVPQSIFYNYEGKIIDFDILPEQKIFALSLVSKKIIFIDYSERPKFNKIIEIELEALSKKILFKDGAVYFATDLGEFYQYNMSTYKKRKLFQLDSSITDFIIENEFVFLSTLNGYIMKVNLETNEVEKSFLNDTFVTTFANHKDNLVCGTWNGEIIMFNKEKMNLVKKKEVHSRSILKIVNHDGIFYSCGIDQSIKKWNY